MLIIAGGILLALFALAIVGRILDTLSASEHDPPESERSLAARQALQAKLARGPCYFDKRGNVRIGLRRWR